MEEYIREAPKFGSLSSKALGLIHVVFISVLRAFCVSAATQLIPARRTRRERPETGLRSILQGHGQGSAQAIVTEEDGMESIAHKFLSAAVKFVYRPTLGTFSVCILSTYICWEGICVQLQQYESVLGLYGIRHSCSLTCFFVYNP